jgi:hypothetical protein
MPDLDRTTLLKAIVHVNPYRADRDEMGETCIFCGEWAMLNEGVKHRDNCIWKLAQVALSEAPAEAFTAPENEVIGRTLPMSIDLFEQRCQEMLGRERRFEWPDMDTVDVLTNAVRLAREFTDYRARLVRERHTGKGSNGSEV